MVLFQLCTLLSSFWDVKNVVGRPKQRAVILNHLLRQGFFSGLGFFLVDGFLGLLQSTMSLGWRGVGVEWA
jgi:hypothetical protein